MKEVFIEQLKDNAWTIIEKKTKEALGSFPLRIDCVEYCLKNNLRIVDTRTEYKNKSF